MPRRGKRSKIEDGIYEDATGIAGVVKVGQWQREKRFSKDVDLDVVRNWRDATRIKLRKRHPVGQRGTLAGDAPAYLRQVRHLASYKARAIEVNAWIAELGHKARTAITRADVLTTRALWLAAGLSPKTVNNRVQTLRHLYRTLDGHDAETPCDRVTPLSVQKTPPQVISAELVVRVDEELQRRELRRDLLDAKTRARFRVLATTGKRPSELMRAQRGDVDLERRVWTVRDGKGGYSPGLYLNDDMLAAWRLFIEAGAWGDFHTNSFARTIRASGWPKHVKPYNLRHTTWITASERGADLADIQAGAGHKHLATTRRHYVPVLSSRMQRLSELIDGRFTFTTVPSAVPPEASTPVDFSKVLRTDGGGTGEPTDTRERGKLLKKRAK